MMHGDFSRWMEKEWVYEEGLMESLNKFSEKLIAWNRDVFGSIIRRKKRVNKRLEGVTRALEMKPTVGLLELERRLEKEWAEVLRQEEVLWMQQSRVDWLRLGDSNTKFFHTTTLVRRRRNKVRMLKDEFGQWVEDAERLKNLAVDYYDHLFKSENKECGELISGRFPNVGEEIKMEMQAETSEEDIRRALRGMAPYKAPGPDGYQVVFFKETWAITGSATTSFVKGIMEGGDIPGEATQALLVLIPKGEHPTSIRDFRPLSLCNTVYKLVAKVIVGRLKEAWKLLISPYQASFVHGRQSIDNVILCQEFVHSMKRKKARKGSVIIKLDLEKAYDRLEWPFIEQTLIDARLLDSLVSVIMKMVTLGTCRLLWNGEVTDVIMPSKGLR